MIKFQIEKLHVEHMFVKQCSSAFGGMITMVDEKKSKKAKREVYSKIKIPHHLARSFKKLYTVTKYIKPVLCAVTYYGKHVVAIERHPLGNLGTVKSDGLFGEVEWFSQSETNIDTFVVALDRDNALFIDGTYIFSYTKQNLKEATSLSKDRKFHSVQMDAFKLQNLVNSEKPFCELRTALGFIPKGGKLHLTPPIWKTLTGIGMQQFKRIDKDDLDDNTVISESMFQFDNIDTRLSVNLGFVLKAGRELSQVFGYDVIEALCLDDLMIQMRTVNLPNIANEVKQTYDTGFPFTHAVAWLIGLVNRAPTLDAYIMLRTLLKHLTTKGVYRRGAFDDVAIFCNPEVTEVPLKTLAEAGAIEVVDINTFSQMGRVARNRGTEEGTGMLAATEEE
jgi:hypothetical protein